MKEHIINTWWISLSIISIINVFFISNYLRKFNEKKDFSKKNKNLINNLLDMNNCDKVCNDYEEWKDEIPWMTGYFTLGVWSCIALVIWFKKYTKI